MILAFLFGYRGQMGVAAVWDTNAQDHPIRRPLICVIPGMETGAGGGALSASRGVSTSSESLRSTRPRGPLLGCRSVNTAVQQPPAAHQRNKRGYVSASPQTPTPHTPCPRPPTIFIQGSNKHTHQQYTLDTVNTCLLYAKRLGELAESEIT